MASLETLITPDLLTFSLPDGTEANPAALDITITSPLCPAILGESCQQAGAAVLAAEARKLHSNGPKCQELGWSCIPLAVETYGNWGKEAQDTISRLASHLAIHQSSPKSSVVAEIEYDPGPVHRQSHPGQGAPTPLTVYNMFVFIFLAYSVVVDYMYAVMPRPARTVRDRIHLTVFDGRP